MNYRVILLSAARDAAKRYLEYIAVEQQMPLTAERWWLKAMAAIETLGYHPHRCSKPPEDEFRHYTIRALRVDRCLFLYTVVEESRTVRIIAFRHGAQLPIHEQLPEDPDGGEV